ncbi:Ig-like domain-containing protein [Ferrimonas pelagia]|uniref:Tandem-95 repeat protein n=1 Tax=Ferrimonas pelagia TaxID=1177826 RepID=A0ABP9EFN9_9GAMM
MGTLSTTDPDADSHTYTLVSGSGDTNNGSFNISGNALRANDASSLSAGNYSVRIQTDDNAGGTYSEAMTIAVVDNVSPSFENSTPSISSTTLDGATVSADLDEDGTVYYVVVANGSTTPSAAQVKAGQDGSGASALASGSFATSGTTGSDTFNGLSAGTAYDLYIVAEDDEGTPNLQASATHVDFITQSPDSDANLTAAVGVTEPVALPSTVDSSVEAIALFDFTLTDGGSADGLALDISQIELNVSGTADPSKISWVLNGPDLTDTAGVYSSNTLTFSSLPISVADSSSEVYTLSANFNDNTDLTDGQTLIVSIDGDTDLTVGASGTQMGSTTAITNSVGSPVEITATQLAWTTQPAGSVSGSTLTTQPVITAQDAFGNTDTDFSETVTLTEASAGTLTGDTVTAVAGIATFSGLTYSATADQQSFTLTANDQDAVGSDIDPSDASAMTADVVATQLVFDTQPAPLAVDSEQATSLTTVPVLSARDANNVVDTGYGGNISLAEINGAGSATISGTGDSDGDSATVTLTPTAGIATFTGLQLTYTPTSGATETFNLQAISGDVSATTSSQLSAAYVLPTITSATFDASTGVLVVTGTGFVGNSGANNDVDVSTLTLTGQGGGTRTLSTSNDVEIDSSTQFTVTLSGADLTAVDALLNRSGIQSADSTSYNLAAADDFIAYVTSGDASDLVANAITVNNAFDADGGLTAANGVSEPVALNFSADTAGEAASLFDFTLTDGGSADGLPLGITQVVFNLGGTSSDAERADITWQLNGPDATNVTGNYNAATDSLTFSGLSLSVSDGASEIYTLSGYYNDTSSLTHGSTVIISIDGDTNLTVSSGGSQMANTSTVTNGTGTALTDDIAPLVTSVSVPANATYTAGNSLDFTINTNENVTVDTSGGTPHLALTIGSATRYADYVSGSGGTALTFRYTVQSGDDDSDGIALAATLAPNSGTLQDAAGNDLSTTLSGVGSLTSVLVDAVAPDAPIGLDMAASSDTGSSDTDDITNDTTPRISGSGELGATVTLFSDLDGDGVLDVGEPSTTSVSAGNWSVDMATLSAANPNTAHRLKAYQTDAAGNVSPVSQSLQITLDTTAPSGHSVALDQDYINGANQASASFAFSAGEVGSSFDYTLSSDGGGTPVIGSGTLDSANMKITGLNLSNLGEGILTLSAILTDQAGNAATAQTDTVTKDVTAPIGYSANFNHDPLSQTNVSNTGFTLSGAEVGSNYHYSISSSGGGSNVANSGTVSASNESIAGIDLSGLDDGTLTLSLTLTDGADNVGSATTDTVDKDVQGPQITSVALNSGDLKGSDTITATFSFDDVVILSDTNNTATLNIGGTSRSASYSSGSGTSTLTYQYVVQTGDNDDDGVAVTSLSLNGDTATDGNGNDADLSFVALTETALLVDTEAPAPVSPEQAAQILNADTQALSQRDYGEEGITIKLLADNDGNGIADNDTAIASDTVNGSSWSLTATLRQDSDNHFVLRAEDAAGNYADLPVGNFQEDSTAPESPTVSAPQEARFQPTTGLTISGAHNENGVTIALFADSNNDGVADNDTQWYSTTVSGNVWSLDLSLAENSTSDYVVAALDAANNRSADVDLVSLTHDDVIPSATVTSNLTNDTTPSLSGTLQDDGGMESLTATLENAAGTEFGPYTINLTDGQPSGNWSLTDVADTLDDGIYDIHLSATDRAGNSQILTDAGTVEVDTQAPAGYTVAIEQLRIDSNNETALSFEIAGGNTDDRFSYQISDGTDEVTGTGTLTSGRFTVENVDVSSLAEAQLTLTLTLTDPAKNTGDPASDSVTKIYNLAPIIAQGSSTSVTMSEDGSPTAFALTLNGSDIDNDALNWSIVSPAALGTASITGNNTTASLAYTPNDNVNGSDSFQVQLSDGSLTDIITVNVTIEAVNDAPVLSGTPSTTVNEDTSYLFTPSVSDLDSSNFSYQIAGKPNWTSFDSTTGALSGTPGNSDVGSYANIVISVTDSAGASASLPAFTITVANTNDAPTLSGAPAISVDQDEAYSFTPTLTDIDVGDSHTFAISGKPSWASFDSTTGALSGTPGNSDVGSYANIVISVTDSADASASLAPFTLSVVNTNDLPQLSVAVLVVEEDGELLFDVQSEDLDEDPVTVEIQTPPEHGELQQTPWRYIPNSNFHGQDSFVLVANDGQADSEPLTVPVTVVAVNDPPQASDDLFEQTANDTGVYTLDVLANDTDIDGDTLSLINAQSSQGSVAIEDDALILTLGADVAGEITLDYVVDDGFDSTDSASVTLRLSGGGDLPTLTVPDDIVIWATSTRTKVDLGSATAEDHTGQPLAVSRTPRGSRFAPGRHEVVWQTVDSEGRSLSMTQTVDVHPLINFGKDQSLAEGSDASLSLYLNGNAPEYPLTVPFSLSGSASDGSDYELSAGAFTFEQGTESQISVTILNDEEADVPETLLLTLAEDINRGTQSTHTLTIVEENLAPSIQLSAQQAGEVRRLFSQDGGPVILSADIEDPDPNDTLTVQWQDAVLAAGSPDLDGDTQLLFDPTAMALGSYEVSASVSDGDLERRTNLHFELVATLAPLSEADSDGDLIPDAQEGYGDDDGDGLENYLDAVEGCNLAPLDLNDQNQNLVEGDAGICIRAGALAIGGENNSINVDELDVLPEPADYQFVSDVVDFVATGLPEGGQRYRLVQPQREPLPANAAYLKYSDSKGWYEFDTSTGDQLHSTAGEKGYCPPPGGDIWQSGLTEGHWCIQLTLSDGGPNDDDDMPNQITDPGGVVILQTDNSAPQAQMATLEMAQGSSLNIDLIAVAQAQDPDGDPLTLVQLDVSDGQIEQDHALQLIYQPPANFIGEATLAYTLSDGNGGSVSEAILIQVRFNQAPEAQPDNATTQDRTSIIVDVLANDSDPDQQPLRLLSVSAEHGSASLTADQQVLYRPQLGYQGVDTVTYRIADPLGAEAEGSLSVTIDAYETITVTHKGSGGGVGPGLLLLAFFAAAGRRKLWRVSAAASTLLCAQAAANWEVSLQSGYSRTSSQTQLDQLQLTQAGFEIDQLHRDNSDWSWGGAIGYQALPQWRLRLGYQDLGEYKLEYRGTALDPAASQQAAAALGPRATSGVTLGAHYRWQLTEPLALELGAGAWWWDSEMSGRSTRLHTEAKEDGTDWYTELGLQWQLNDHWSVGGGWQYFAQDGQYADDIDNLYLRLSLGF